MTSKRERFILFGKNLLAKLGTSLQRFPETLLVCTATVIVLIMLNQGYDNTTGEPGEYLMRLAAVLALGIPLSLSIKVFFERKPTLQIGFKILLYIAAAAALTLYYYFLLQEFNMISISRYAAITLALYLSFTVIPYFYRRQNFEHYMIGLFISFLITYLFASVLFGGLAAILGTINYLFSARISEKIFLDIWLIVGGIFAPAFFLADIPPGERPNDSGSYPRVLEMLLSYIMIPLILAYSAILYLYSIKILVTQQWPEVMVSHLVLWYALISTLVLFCVYPLRQSNRWIRSFTAYFPILLLPLLVTMFAAMGVRVNAYGLTENRYFVLAAGLWVTGSMLYLIISKKPRNIFLPASLALVAALTICGPWSAYALSVRSQNHRFEKIALEFGLLQEGKIVKPTAAVPDKTRQEISSIVLYFDRYHGLERLRALPKGFSTEGMEALFGFPLYPEYSPPEDAAVYFYLYMDEQENWWKVSGVDYLMQFSSSGQHYRTEDFEAIYSPENQELKIIFPDRPDYTQNVGDIAVTLYRNSPVKDREQLSKEELTFVEEDEGLTLQYLFKAINGWEKGTTGEIHIDFLEFYLFVELKPTRNG